MRDIAQALDQSCVGRVADGVADRVRPDRQLHAQQCKESSSKVDLEGRYPALEATVVGT